MIRFDSEKARGLPWVEALAVLIACLYGLALLSAGGNIGEDRVFLGFTHIDQIVYYANAREAFENGNGLFYASPYSSSPDSPRIYSSFVFLVFGYLWKIFGLSFTAIDHLLRLVFGPIALVLAVRVFRKALPDRRLGLYACIVLISCSGLAWLIALSDLLVAYVLNLLDSASAPTLLEWFGSYPDLFAGAEGGYGEWHLNLLRHLMFTPEIMYHTLFLACILCLLHGRYLWAHGFLFLTWWSHPFTGVELGFIVVTFLATEFLLGRKVLLSQLVAVVCIDAVFIIYYLIFLPRFPEHASVSRQMRAFGNPMLLHMLLPAYGMFCFLGLLYFTSADFRRRMKENSSVRLMFAWFICAVILVFHDRILFFTDPLMPMHFTRGYLFIPLVFFSMCWIQSLISGATPRKQRIVRFALIPLFMLHVPDNLVDLYNQRRSLARSDHAVFSISRPSHELLQRLDAFEETLTIHAMDLPPGYPLRLEYFIPVLTHHRSLVGHHLNVPFIRQKGQMAAELHRDLSARGMKELGLTGLLLGESSMERIENILSQSQYRLIFQMDGVYFIHLLLDSTSGIDERSL